MVMAMSENGSSERGVGGDINMTFVCKDPLGILPVRQARTEGGGDRSVHGLQCWRMRGLEVEEDWT